MAGRKSGRKFLFGVVMVAALAVGLIIVLGGSKPRATGYDGFGATTAAWNAGHAAVSGMESAYGPSIPGSEGANPEWTVVSSGGGRVDSFVLSLPTGTPVATAKRLVLAQLPHDARITWYQVIHDTSGSCAFMNVRSATLGRLFGSRFFGDPTGTVGVSLDTAVSASLVYEWNPQNVEVANMALGPLNPNISC